VPTFVIKPAGIGELRDISSASEAAAKVIAKADAGDLNIESAKFLLDSIERFAKLYEQQVLEMRVLAIEQQLALNARTDSDARTLRVIEGGAE
jgi:hypothetical protein